ncbi:EAL domain-containing protein [Salinimonas marina]|uniref:EAL domain-containing protein n=1 Tax=Salinimonas marina TaxID=2785918 RepID=A0A7S9E0R7_9ALTE|nr:EAL domain-containing protein [Salinimonas marina]
MKSLRSEISFHTIASIAIVSGLIIGLSIYVYEKLYIEFVATEVNATAENMAVDLLGVMGEPAGSFNQAQVLLRLEEYEYVQSAGIYRNDGVLLNSYIGSANQKADQHSLTATVETAEVSLLSDDSIVENLPEGLHHIHSKVVVIKSIGETSFPMGKLVLAFNLEDAIKESRLRYITLVTPSVVVLILVFLLLTTRLHRRSLKPLENLIKTMDSVVDEKSYDVKVPETSKVETAALSRAFNNMMTNIKLQSELNNQKTALLEQQQSEMEKLANFDVLTGLPNRQHLMRKLAALLARAQMTNSEVALMFIDVDGFKDINDSFGHDTGDKLLLRISSLLNQSLPDNATLGRLGGDEFLVLIDNVSSRDEIENIASKLLKAADNTHNINRIRLGSTISMGIALASNCNYELSTLITNADVAMYRAKQEGRARYEWFSLSMYEATHRKVQVSTRISHGLAHGDFYLAYQAKVGPKENIIGFEVLLRWYDEVLGHVSPGEFIPIAEQTDKISQITLWVVKRACEELPLLIKEFGENISISLNLSPQDVNSSEVTDFILGGLASNDIPAKHIEFEITETAYMNNFGYANSFFEALKISGCHLSLDDFGTGYSSLSYLTEFNIDTLKIDKQFVSQIGQSERSEQITVAIIQMAKSLNLLVCAEGVETKAQAEFLIEKGCEILQGFLYSRPTPLKELLARRADKFVI